MRPTHIRDLEMKKVIRFSILTAIAIAMMSSFSSCDNGGGDGDGGGSGGPGSVTVQNQPAGTKCYITVFNYSGTVKNLKEMYSKVPDWDKPFATGDGTSSPVKINKELDGVYFLTINPNFKYPYLYFEQVRFTKGEATIDWKNPTFTWDGSDDWFYE